jgi:antitoxin VapB
MALSIKDPEADRLAREISRETGETLTTAVVESLRERLQRLRRNRAQAPRLADELLAIARRVSALPVIDGRTPEQIIGYDESGLPR